MFLGTAVEVSRRARITSSWDWFFCEDDSSSAEGPLYFWRYVYYLSKYYELFDTILALLNGSSIPHFKLHVIVPGNAAVAVHAGNLAPPTRVPF